MTKYYPSTDPAHKTRTAAVGVFLALSTLAFSATISAATAQGIVTNGSAHGYIVVLNDGTGDSGTIARQMARRHGIGLRHIYGAALKGFAGDIPDASLPALAQDPRVKYVEPDAVVIDGVTAQTAPQGAADFRIASSASHQSQSTQPAQIMPMGIKRVCANVCSQLAGNGSGSTNIDVAIIDSGIQPDHPDLNVVGGVNFTGGNSSSYGDGYWRGTYVAGIVGAMDNGIGVVGVAPGARLWAVKTFDSKGYATWSQVIAGINWVAQRAGTIKVATMCYASTHSQAANDAVKAAVGMGVVFVDSAGHGSIDASYYSPASEPSALCVTTLADSDGLPGGLGPATPYGADDTFASFADFGACVAMIAPGINLPSTWMGGTYGNATGDVPAAAHVAGAAALYLSTHPGASPADVRAALIAAATEYIAGPDGGSYPLVNVHTF